MQGRGRRLGQRRRAGRHVLRDRDQAAFGYGHQLGECARPRHAHHGTVAAQIVAALDAEIAIAAVDQGVRRDPFARAAAADQFAHEFMAEDQGRIAAGIMPVIRMHVRAADAHGLDAQQRIAVRQGRIRLFAEHEFAGRCVHQGFHGGIP
ncbi:hypothetical protein D3C72_1819130 [compost metagenome]